MPTLSVKRDVLFDRIGHEFTDDHFDDLCFQFGIELDEVTSERQQVSKEQGALACAASSLSDDVIYKIELPANRYDLMSLEGLAKALKCYLSRDGPDLEQYHIASATHQIIVDPSVAGVRPFVVGAILRNISFTPDRYEAFIELQDKLHNGIGRRREIVSMGTHDLDTVSGPFHYTALPPPKIQFRPLNQTDKMDGARLMQFYEGDLKLRKYLPLIRGRPAYPVVLDASQTVCSLPPIINSDHSKIKLSTRNVLIEVTGTDLNKLKTALNVFVSAFSGYCEVIEGVRIVYPESAPLETPDMSARTEKVSIGYINRSIGVRLSGPEICMLLRRMMLRAECSSDPDIIDVTVPCTRPDILHACDIMEDVAIAYGFNNIARTLPQTVCTGSTDPLNRLTDLLRREVALTGFTEVLTLTLCSKKENFDHLLRSDPGNEAVVLSNPATAEYEVVHTLLVPEMLKTVSANKRMPLPIKVFQIADVVLLDPRHEVGARNQRRLCAVFCGNTASGFEAIHGLLDRVMQMLKVSSRDKQDNGLSAPCYHIEPSQLPFYFPGRQARIILNGRLEIGSFGIVHPKVLSNFEIPNVASLMEIDIEPFL